MQECLSAGCKWNAEDWQCNVLRVYMCRHAPSQKGLQGERVLHHEMALARSQLTVHLLQAWTKACTSWVSLTASSACLRSRVFRWLPFFQ